jgi:hypothetical protein
MRRCIARLCRRVLPDNTTLDGVFVGAHLVEGTATLPDGRKYVGKFDSASGVPLPDTVLHEDGDVYQGAFNDKWQRHGEGAAMLADGTKYAGVFLDDELTHGIVRIPETQGELKFTGSLKDEQFVKGRLENADYVYEGEFENNQPHGRGTLKFTSGALQEGTFYRGQLHGPNGKLRLESGHVYTGDFVGGRIRSGVLRTPTFTYEGDFNEQGMAEGEGRAEYLTMDPRVVFTGVWKSGSMIEGSAADEYGNPLDYQNNPDLQAAVSGQSDVTTSNYVGSQVSERFARFRDMNDAFIRDAEEKRSSTGKVPDKFDLGYEAGVADTQRQVHESQKSQLAELSRSGEVERLRLKQHEEDVRAFDRRDGELNEPVARITMMKQRGFQGAMSDNADQQFARYLESDGGEGSKGQKGLEIDGNQPWKTYMAKK